MRRAARGLWWGMVVLELLVWAAAFADASTPLIDAVKNGDQAGVNARLHFN